MPRTKKFNEEEVLNKARELFWVKGFYDTSMQDLVDTLGINRASLYGTFGSKKELFYSALELHQSHNITRLQNFLKEQGDVAKIGLKTFFEMLIDSSLKDQSNKGCFIVNSTMELIPSDSKVETIISNYQRSVQGIFFDFLEMGKSMGQLSKDLNSSSTSSMLCTLLMGIRVMGKIVRSKEELLATVNGVLSLVK